MVLKINSNTGKLGPTSMYTFLILVQVQLQKYKGLNQIKKLQNANFLIHFSEAIAKCKILEHEMIFRSQFHFFCENHTFQNVCQKDTITLFNIFCTILAYK